MSNKINTGYSTFLCTCKVITGAVDAGVEQRCAPSVFV